MRKYNVGIIGATGMVGQRFITLLANHPWFNIKVLAASSRSAGKPYLEVVGSKWAMKEPMPDIVKNMIIMDASEDIQEISDQVDFVFCAVNMPKDEVKKLEEAYAKAECPVMSNNSANRFTDDVPMIIPEINADHSQIIPFQKKRLGTKRGFIAVKSNCSLQSYVPAVNAFMKFGVSKVLACTYQAISGAGKTFETWPDMVDNIIPYIGGEEEKSEREPMKIWGAVKDGKIQLTNTPGITSQCIRVPVSDGHTAAVFVSFKDSCPDIQTLIDELESYQGEAQKLNLPSAPKQFLHYFTEDDRPQIKSERNLENGMAVSVGRLRKDSQYDIKFVCMSHNTLRGAAGGAVLMAELLCKQGYIDKK
ncbi:MAG: aspartate-semialdehyde dehydrogenase [Clostridia bacterium]|nr:aspartate-semialdehyde dehydrogenase [Clostridia bacterium]